MPSEKDSIWACWIGIWKKRAKNQVFGAASRNCKRPENGFPPTASRKKGSHTDTLLLAQCWLISDFWPKELEDSNMLLEATKSLVLYYSNNREFI